MLQRLLEVDELVDSIEISVDKVYHFSANLFTGYFGMREPQAENLVNGYKGAKIEQDTVLDYTIKICKDVKMLVDVIEKMCEEEQRREGITVPEKGLGGAHYE